MRDEIIHGTGNVFADLGMADASARQLKTQLAILLNARLAAREAASPQVAELLGITQPAADALARYRLDGFSVAMLRGFLEEVR